MKTTRSTYPRGHKKVPAEVRPVRLVGPVAEPEAEISGMDWHGDTLVLLPQYPAAHGKRFFALERDALVAAANGDRKALRPFPIPVDTGGLCEMPGFEGLESLVIRGHDVYATVELQEENQPTQGYLIKGRIAADTSRITFDTSTLTLIPFQREVENMGYESLFLDGDTLVTLYEMNGARVNPEARGFRFDLDLKFLGPVPMPPVDYRITDATHPDEDGRFWVTNYHFEGERKHLPLGARKATPRKPIERLVELQMTDEGIIRTDRAPWNLRAEGAPEEGRNWEALVPLAPGDERFVAVTDKFPETTLAILSRPEEPDSR